MSGRRVQGRPNHQGAWCAQTAIYTPSRCLCTELKTPVGGNSKACSKAGNFCYFPVHLTAVLGAMSAPLLPLRQVCIDVHTHTRVLTDPAWQPPGTAHLCLYAPRKGTYGQKEPMPLAEPRGARLL